MYDISVNFINVCILVEGINPGTLRLVGSNSPNKGRVQVFIGGQWVRVCDDGWDDSEAGVVCRQLGFGSSGKARQLQTSGMREIMTSNFKCSGNEARLLQCNHNEMNISDCDSSDDVEVICTGTLLGSLQ